jgi:hypothetical protein
MSDVAAGDPNADYALSVLRHDVLRPRLEEVIESHRSDGTLDPVSLGGELRPLIEEALDGTSVEDWQIAALCLIEDDRGASVEMPSSFARRSSPGAGRRAA